MLSRCARCYGCFGTSYNLEREENDVAEEKASSTLVAPLHPQLPSTLASILHQIKHRGS